MKNIKPTHLALGLIGLGFVAIGLGWSGAANVNCVDCQVPYLLSGGVFGLALIILGAGLILFESGRRARAHIEDKIDQLIVAVRESKSVVPTEPNGVAVAKPRAAERSSTNGMVVVGRSSFHRQTCRLVEGKEGLDYASAADAVARGLTPCRVCEPARATR